MSRTSVLAQVLAEFARTLGTEFSIDRVLARLVERVVDLLPVTAAGVMVMGEDDRLHVLAASDETIEQIQLLQNELREGPSLDAYRTGEPVAVPDLHHDERFPSFSPRARTAGPAAVFTFPMQFDGQRLGALDMCRDVPGGLDDGDVEVAQVLADVAAAYLFNARAREVAATHLAQLRHHNLHDPLTGLPNRQLLGELLERAVARGRRSHLAAAVLFVDLDRFKTVNDRFGHHVGDLVLTAVALRLEAALRPGDTLARLAGDEFVVLCEDLTAGVQAELVADRIRSVLVEPFEVDGRTVLMSASIGIAFSGPGEDIPGSLLRDADFAMYQAKAAGGAQHRVVNRDDRLAADREAGLESDVLPALTGGHFRLAYQPIVRTTDLGVVGVEALLRWPHPERGPIRPDVLVPLAERAGLILDLGTWVLHRACTDFVRLRDTYGDALGHVAVNVSAYQVVSPTFGRTVTDVLDATGMDPARLHLEVTESVTLDDPTRVRTVMDGLKEVGVRFSLDDFGMGYSCLSYLRLLPFDSVKIDRSFVAGLTGPDAATPAIIEMIIGLGRALRLPVVAEGVETAEQLAEVTALGATFAQGYLLGPPLYVEDLERQMLDVPEAG